MLPESEAGGQTVCGDSVDPLVSKLSASERSDLGRLNTFFRLTDDRNKRNFGMSTFIKHINMIHSFIVRGERNANIKGNICGILFGSGFLLVNTEKLKKLTRRSKSCVNGCFQRLGYGVIRIPLDLNGFFSKIFPDILPQLYNSRHWCIRKQAPNSLVSFVPHLPPDLCSSYGFIFSESYVKDSMVESDSSPPSEPESIQTQLPLPFLFDIKSLLNRPEKV